MQEPIGGVGRADRAEELAFRRRLDAAQDGPAFAGWIVVADDLLEIETPLGVKGAISLVQAQAPIGDGAEAAPFETLPRLENLGDLGLRYRVALARHGANVLIFHFLTTLVDLAHEH